MDPSALYTHSQSTSQADVSNSTGGDVNGAARNRDRNQGLREVIEKQVHERNRKGWRKLVLNFTPS
jgi:hypothetical protein